MTISPARRAAFEILRRVEDEGAYSSTLLARMDDDLSAKDRALCHEIVLGVVRRQLWLDRTIEHFANRRIDSLDLPVVIALRTGLYQLRFLSRVPASAAINESVNLVKAARLKSAATFVNAVLRRATREPDYDPAFGVIDPIEKLSIETSHPAWFIERWAMQFGSDQAAAIAQANNRPGATQFRLSVKAIKDVPQLDELLKHLQSDGAIEPSPIVRNSWRLNRSSSDCPLRLRSWAEDGLVYFQDEGSQLVAHLLGVQENERVLDVCAAPGGKSTLMAALAPRCRIISCELYEHRMRTMKELAIHQGAHNIDFVIHDATRPLPFLAASFDRVLVDAPCSGTGTLRRNPEIRWRLRPEDVSQLAEKQKTILANASESVRAGGSLLYSTCSLEIEENEAVVKYFLNHHSDFEIDRFESQIKFETEAGARRTWPYRDEIDGFFAIRFRRFGVGNARLQ